MGWDGFIVEIDGIVVARDVDFDRIDGADEASTGRYDAAFFSKDWVFNGCGTQGEGENVRLQNSESKKWRRVLISDRD